MLMKRLAKRIPSQLKEQRGQGLLETVAAVGILGVVGVAFMMALSTGFRGTETVNQVAAENNLAVTALEKAISLSYASSYAPSISTPPGYSFSIAVTPLYDGNLQKVAVTVFRDGNAKFTLEAYKADKGQ